MALNNLGLGFVFTAKDMFSAVVNEVGKTLKDVTDTSEKALKKWKDHAEGLRGIGIGIGAIGGAGLAFFGVAEAAAQKFGKGIAEVSTLVDEATFSVHDMEEITMGMAERFGGDVGDEIKGLYQGISAGAENAAQSIALLDSANKLAIGGVTDTRSSVDALTNVMNAYSLSYTKANEVSDAFVTAAKKGKTNVTELAASIGMLAPLASAMGVSYTEAIGSVAAVTAKGLNTATAITGLKAALTGVIKPASETAAEAQRLGIKFDAATLRSKGFKGFLDSITGSAKFNKDSMAKLFGSVEGLNAILALTANGGKAFTSTLDAMAHRTGAVDEAFAKMSETSDFQSQRFKAIGNNALILIGKALQPMTVAIMKVVNALLEAFTKIPGPVMEMIVRALAAAAAVAVLVGGFIAAKSALVVWLLGLKVAGVTIGSVALALGPLLVAIGLLALAFAGLKVAYEENLGGFADKLDAAFKKVRLAFLAVGQLLSTGALSGSVLKELNAGEGGVKAFAINVYLAFNRVKNFALGIGAGFKAGVAAVQPSIDAFMNSIRRLLAVFADWGKNDPASANYDAWKSFGEMGASVGRSLSTVFGFVIDVFTGVIDIAGGAMTEFRKMGTTWDLLINSGKALWTAVGNIAAAFGSGDAGASGAARSFGGTLADVIGVIATVIGFVVGLAAAVGEVLASAIGGAISIVKTLWNTLMALGALIVSIVDGDWSTAWYAMKDIAAGVIKIIIQALVALLGAVGGVVDAIAKTFGKDLGLKAALEGGAAEMQKDLDVKLGLKTEPIKLPPRSASPAAVATATADGVAAANLQNVISSQAAPAADHSGDFNVSMPIMLDGEVIGTAMASKKKGQATRSFSAQPIPG